MLTRLLQSYFAFRAWGPVWRFLNRHGRALHRAEAPALGPVEARVARDLVQNGIALTHLDELFPGSQTLFSGLADYARELGANAKTRTNKTFLKNLLPTQPVLALENPFVRISIAEPVVRIVNAYLGLAARFFYFTLNVTLPVGAGSAPVQSQRWHRDPEDRRMCKMFIYLTDVDERSGPFTYARGSHWGGPYGRLYPQRWPKGAYPPPGGVERRVDPRSMLVGAGRAGTVIFADTAGLHRGGYATDKERVMFTAGYFSPASVRHIKYRYPENFWETFAMLPAVSRQAVTPLAKRFSSLLFYRFKKRFSADYEDA